MKCPAKRLIGNTRRRICEIATRTGRYSLRLIAKLEAAAERRHSSIAMLGKGQHE